MRTRWLLVSGTLVVVALVVALGVLRPGVTGGSGVVTVADLCDESIGASFEYDGSSSGYLSDRYPGEIVPGACEDETLAAGSELNLSLLVHSSAPSVPHELFAVSVESPYRLVELSPGTPQLVEPGGNVTFSLQIAVPLRPGVYGAPAAVVATR